MKRLFYVYSQPRKSWYFTIKKGNLPDHILYGLNWLKQPSYRTYFSDLGFSKWNLLKWPISPLQKKFINQVGTGFQLDQALVLLPQLRAADLIITTNDSCGLPVAFLKQVKLLQTPQIYIHMKLTSAPDQHPILHKFISSLLKQPRTIISVSLQGGQKLISNFGISNQRLRCFPPGIDTHFFQPRRLPSKHDLVAIGRDPGRDYKTLFQAIQNLPIKALVICDLKNITNLPIPPNVTLQHQVSYLKVRQAYHQARIVILPTKTRAISGQTNFLEALACAKPLITADTPTLHQSFKQENQAHCLYYRPENSIDLRRKISYLLNHPQLQKSLARAARKTALQYSSRKFAEKLTTLINLKP